MHYFLVYHDGRPDYMPHITKLLESVREHGKQFEIILFPKKDMDPEFLEKNQSILSLGRGGGYWLWKPYIILTVLKKLNNNDILFYLDSKYFFVENFEDLYMNKLLETDIVVWKNKPNEAITYLKNYCKMDVIKKYNIEDLVFNQSAECCWAGAIVIKKTEKTMKIIKKWFKMCCNEHDITDSESVVPNNDSFKEHRHDQSLLSIILHKYNIPFYYFEKKYLQNVRYPW